MDGYMPGMDGNNHHMPPATEHQRHRAALAVCARATDADDARHLLGMLGLLPQPEPEPAPKPPAPAPRREPWLDSDGHPHVCKHGHIYTAANTRWRRDGLTPVCRECDSAAGRRARRGNRA